MNTFTDNVLYTNTISLEELKENISRILIHISGQTVLDFNTVDGYETIECQVKKNFKNNLIPVSIRVNISKSNVVFELKAIVDIEKDKNDYTTDLTLFYYQEIRLPAMDITYTAKKEYTVRIYKLIYNASTIKGYYSINGFYPNEKITFHSLYEVDRDEPRTEHIICFDIQLHASNFEQARNRANNIILEFCDYLSVLLDIGFFEPSSRYMNFVRPVKQNGVTISYALERYRTAFADPDLSIIVKDNLNGLCPIAEVEKHNFMNGYYSLSFLDSNPTSANSCVILTAGEPDSIEDVFSKLKTINYKSKAANQSTYSDTIQNTTHYMNSEIKIPRQIRKYFKEITRYREAESNYQLYTFFRNACRLYNKSKMCSTINTSLELSLLVAAVETLAKTEKTDFSPFVSNYYKECSKIKIDDMYEIRSKLFHAGEFSFFEYNININPFHNKQYNECTERYREYKNILRSVFITWIQKHFDLNA